MSWQMRNATGAPVDVQLSIGTLRIRAATGYAYGARTYRGLVQTYRGPGDSWNPGDGCDHRHKTAESALECAQKRVDRHRVPELQREAADAMQRALG